MKQVISHYARGFFSVFEIPGLMVIAGLHFLGVILLMVSFVIAGIAAIPAGIGYYLKRIGI